MEGFIFLTIHKDGDGDGVTARLDELNGLGGELKEEKGVSYERPFNSIKSLFQVNLKDHVRGYTFYFFAMEDIFLDNDGMITGSSFREEAGLTGVNEMREKRLDSVDDGFSNEFIDGVTESNGPAVPNIVGILVFRNQA